MATLTSAATHVLSDAIPVVSKDEARRVAETFQVLGDPTRVRIVHALSTKELCTSELASLLEMSESAVSHQLRTLRQLRVVRSRREGKLVIYSLDDEHIRRLFEQGLEHTRESGEPDRAEASTKAGRVQA